MRARTTPTRTRSVPTSLGRIRVGPEGSRPVLAVVRVLEREPTLVEYGDGDGDEDEDEYG
jgi:hypothetical protein